MENKFVCNACNCTLPIEELGNKEALLAYKSLEPFKMTSTDDIKPICNLCDAQQDLDSAVNDQDYKVVYINNGRIDRILLNRRESGI